MIALAVAQQAIGLVIPRLGALLAVMLAGWLIWAARPRYLPALMINQLTAGNFAFLGHEGSATAPNLGAYGLAAAIFVRVSWELWNNPDTLRQWRWLVWAWYVASALAVVMSLMGRFEGNPSWTVPARSAWTMGAFFYGMILARRWSPDGKVLAKNVFPMVFVFLLLLSIPVFDHKLKFILVPLAFPLAWFVWRDAGWKGRVAAVFVVLMAAGLGVGSAVSGEEVDPTGNYGIGGATFSLNALFGASVALTFMVAFGSRYLRAMMGRLLGWPVLVFVAAFTLWVAAVGPKYRLDQWTRAERLDLTERIKLKIFDDRSRIWTTALEDVSREGYLVRASGTSIWIDHPLMGEREWSFGAHNSIMNSLLVHRWVGGVLVLVMVGAAMQSSARALALGRFSHLHALAIFVAVTGGVGLVVNDYPTNDEGGFWFMGLAGLVAGVLREHERSKQRARAPESTVIAARGPVE
jgi:hypothetical protein